MKRVSSVKKLKNKPILSGAATMAALFLGLNVNAARMDMVDVSNNNGYMSTAEYVSMRNEFGVKALTVKISEGTAFKDGYAASNIANSQVAGLYVNGYHFAHYTTKAQAIIEADFVGQAAKAAGLPVGAVLATDVESAEEQGILSQATNDRNNAAFMKEIQKFGYRADIYTSGSWANNKMTIKGKTGWVAGYPFVPAGKQWYTNNNAWQWSGSAHFRISYGGFDVSQLYNDYYTAGQKSTIKPTDPSAVKDNNQDANKHRQAATSAKWVKESKTYTLKTAVKLRTGASTSSSVVAILPAGSTIKTDQAIIQGGYRWVRQPRLNGYGYLATGPANNTLEYVKSGASHTYYTVKSGDSWWSIAQRNDLSMYTLASQNSKTINSTLYPSNKLQIN